LNHTVHCVFRIELLHTVRTLEYIVYIILLLYCTAMIQLQCTIAIQLHLIVRMKYYWKLFFMSNTFAIQYNSNTLVAIHCDCITLLPGTVGGFPKISNYTNASWLPSTSAGKRTNKLIAIFPNSLFDRAGWAGAARSGALV
jgi:hypothetical protein